MEKTKNIINNKVLNWWCSVEEKEQWCIIEEFCDNNYIKLKTTLRKWWYNEIGDITRFSIIKQAYDDEQRKHIQNNT